MICTENLKKLPVGFDDFKKIRENHFYYVDKTQLIEHLLQKWGEVNLFTRPRRFGKTLNMSMLKNFFEIGTDETLFEGLYISENQKLCEEYMGKYPVIFLSMKDVDGLTYDEAENALIQLIGSEAARFPFLLNSDKLSETEKEQYRGFTIIQNGKYQQEYLDICTGVKGVKLLYDTYFKAIMNPDTRPERLNDFLSEILGKKVKILKVLTNESAQIAAESSLLIMDIVVQFEDGSIANVEVQKIGYLFPGQRSACYSSDLLLRQYKRVRAELGQGFTYRKIQKVYTIVLFEKSNSDFSNFSKEIYIHHFEQKSDTGVEMNLLQEYTFICLDIFGDIIQNEDRKIENRLEEWLVFLSQDDPDMIIKLLNQNADFQEIYEEVYTICLNMERMMEMFSKELAILDRNTVKLMIDEMEEEVVEAKRKADEAVRKADEAERKADEAESRAKQAEHREKQAREEVDNLKKELEKMKNI